MKQPTEKTPEKSAENKKECPWQVVFPDGDKKAALLAACRGNERMAGLLDRVLYTSSWEAKNHGIPKGECKEIEIARSRISEETLNFKLSERSLITYLNVFDEWKFVRSKRYGRSLIVSFETIQQAIDHPPTPEAKTALHKVAPRKSGKSSTFKNVEDKNTNAEDKVEDERVLQLLQKVEDLQTNVANLQLRVEDLQLRVANLQLSDVPSSHSTSGANGQNLDPTISYYDSLSFTKKEKSAPAIARCTTLTPLFEDEESSLFDPDMFSLLPVVQRWLSQSPKGDTHAHPLPVPVRDSAPALLHSHRSDTDQSQALNPVIVSTTEARDVVTPSLPYDETPTPEIASQSDCEGVTPTEVTRNAKQAPHSYSRSSAISDEQKQETPQPGKGRRRGSGTRKTEQPAPEPEKPKGPPPMPASDVSLSAEVLVQIMEAKKGRRYSDTTRSQELNVAKKLLKMEYEDAPISREQMEEAIDDMLSWSLWKTIPTKPMLKHLQKDDKILNILDELKKKPRKKPSSSSNGSSQQNLANQALDEDERRKQIDAKNKANLEKLRQRHAAMQQKSAQKGA